MPDTKASVLASLREGQRALERFLSDGAQVAAVARAAELLAACFRAGGKALACGNGGSACDAIHFAEEFTGRFRKDRAALPVIPLTDAAHITCVGNDYGFEAIFARGVAAYGKPGDMLVALSTSGNSRNVILAVDEAKRLGLSTFLLLGREGGQLRGRGDVEIVVAAETTDRIQEIHMLALHIVIECAERILFPGNYAA